MKKNIVLADNSYTIRRIVELSFSDEENIELISYENGQDIQDKLLELKPSVVLVDIKLPEMNGYEVCRFINESSELNNTKVFLIKGGFEPVDEEQLKGLKYEDFITKPFDSKALVITIKSMLEDFEDDQKPEEIVDIPSSMPEEISEINDIMDGPASIDFSDVKSDMDSGGLMDSISAPDSETSIRDEVLPSEEITQGSGVGETEDKLSPEPSEEISNPFKDEASKTDSISEEEAIIKENIKMQEEELEIGSLTMEEINIQKEIDQKKGIDPEPETPIKVDTPEVETPIKVDTPEVETPIKVDTPEVETPIKVDTPEVETPIKVDTPEVKSQVEPEISSEEPIVEEEEKDPLDPSLSNMDSSDLDNVFSIDKAGTAPEETEPVDSGSGEETKQKSEEIKQVLEQLETESHDKEEVPKEDTSERIVGADLSEKMANLTDLQDNNKIVEKVEDKLTVSVKEILWEIVPPLAEKIIKSEINKLKSEIDKEY
ncbi:MAG: response regulator [Acidobacteriota bacterium]